MVHPAIDAKMRAAGEAWKAEATARVHVRTGRLKASLGYSYDAKDKRLILFADENYSIFEELLHPFMRPAMYETVPRIWRGGLAGAITGHSTELQFANTAHRYEERAADRLKGRTKGARVKIGHGRFR